MIETMLRPSWIKDTIGVLLVLIAGGLYAAGATHTSPCDCGAVGDDDEDVEAVDARIDAVSQSVVILKI